MAADDKAKKGDFVVVAFHHTSYALKGKGSDYNEYRLMRAWHVSKDGTVQKVVHPPSYNDPDGKPSFYSKERREFQGLQTIGPAHTKALEEYTRDMTYKESYEKNDRYVWDSWDDAKEGIGKALKIGKYAPKESKASTKGQAKKVDAKKTRGARMGDVSLKKGKSISDKPEP